MTRVGPHFAVAIAVVVACRCADAQCQYEITTIAPADGMASHDVRVTALNDLGQAAGTIGNDVFIRTPEAGMIVLSAPGQPLHPDFPTAVALNNVTGTDGLGQLVCNLEVGPPSFTTQAFLYDDGVWTALNTDLQFSTSARGINNAGLIVGERNTAEGHKFFRWQDGVFTDIDQPLGNADLHALNDHGVTAGSTIESDQIFLWDGETITFLDSIASGSVDIFPWHLNNQGHIAGDVYFAPSRGKTTPVAPRAFLKRGNKITWFEVEGFPNSMISGFNELEQVVIEVYYADETGAELDHYLWQNGQYARLRDLLTSEQDDAGYFQFRTINNRGQIAGWRWQASKLVGVILTPVNRPVGDIDCNCEVDPIDLATLLTDWGQCNDVGFCRSDLVSSATLQPPGDGVVNAADLAFLLGSWTTP